MDAPTPKRTVTLPIWLVGAVVVIGAIGIGVGAYALGRDRAGSRKEAQREQLLARQAAARSAERRSFLVARRRGYSQGLANGRAAGRARGENNGNSGGQAEVSRRAAQAAAAAKQAATATKPQTPPPTDPCKAHPESCIGGQQIGPNEEDEGVKVVESSAAYWVPQVIDFLLYGPGTVSVKAAKVHDPQSARRLRSIAPGFRQISGCVVVVKTFTGGSVYQQNEQFKTWYVTSFAQFKSRLARLGRYSHHFAPLLFAGGVSANHGRDPDEGDESGG